MCSKRRGMIEWLRGYTDRKEPEIQLIVARAFKHDTVEMENKRNLVGQSLRLKLQFEDMV